MEIIHLSTTGTLQGYLVLSQDRLMSSYLAFSAKGLTLRFDETPMRIYVDGVLQHSIGTFVRCATLHSTTTSPLELLPIFSCPRSRDARGIVAALRLEELNIAALGMSKGMKFISIVSIAVASPSFGGYYV